MHNGDIEAAPGLTLDKLEPRRTRGDGEGLPWVAAGVATRSSSLGEAAAAAAP
jgi:hypothetical protein